MQMRKTLCSPSVSFISIRFGSCEVRRVNVALDTRKQCTKALRKAEISEKSAH